MAKEFRHKDAVSGRVRESEYEHIRQHILNDQATGMLVYASSATQLSGLSVGADNYILSVATDTPAWISPAALLADISPLTTRGDIMYRNATISTRLAKGAANTVLVMGADDPAWSATLAGLTLTSPTINGTIATTGLTLPAVTLAGTVAGGDQNIDSLGCLGVGAACDADIIINVSKTLTDTDNSGKAAIKGTLQVAKTSAAMTSAGWGLYGQVILDSTNTQNWTHADAGLRGVCGYVGTETGSTGTVTVAASVFANAIFTDSATVTNYHVFHACTPAVAGSKVTNLYGLYICDMNTGATLNYAIYTNAGLVRFGGVVTLADSLTLQSRLLAGTIDAPVAVGASVEGIEVFYSGDNADVTAIRARGILKTTDTTATAMGGLIQASNWDGIDAGCLNGALIEAIGKSTTTAATITTMRACLVNSEWGAFDIVTDLRTLHVRTHTLNNATIGYFATSGYLVYLENEAVGGNGQPMTAGIYFKNTNISGGQDGYTLGIDFSGATITTADIKFHHGATLLDDGTSLTLGGANLVGSLGAVTLNGTVTLNSQSFNAGSGWMTVNTTGEAGIDIISTQDSQYGAILKYQTISATPVNGDEIMRIDVRGRNDNSETLRYFYWQVHMEDISDGIESGSFSITMLNGGANNLAFKLSGAGALNLDSVLQAGAAMADTVAYNRFGATATSHSMASDDDLMISGKLEVDGVVYLDSYTTSVSYHELTEMSAPGVGAANTARIYAFEGAGDALTDLCAVFQDGTVDVFAQEATEPDSPIFEFPDKTELRTFMRKPDRKTIQFVSVFPDGREFVMREIRYPTEKW